jgi:hypothetical protein
MCRIVSAAGYGYSDIWTKFEGDKKMLAFYVALAVLGAAFISNATAALAKQRAKLQPVLIGSADRRQR